MPETDFNYHLFFELSPDLLCIAGYDGYFKKVNAAVSRTLGYTFDELYARPINDFVHPDDKDVTSRVRKDLTQSKPLHHFENRYITKGGETIWLSWTSLPVENEECIFAIAKNVTHKKRLEADRNGMLANLTRMNKDLMQMNYATSDDLKSPVHSLLALFDLIDISRISDKETIELLGVLQYVGEKVRKTLNAHVNQLSQRDRQERVLQETDLRLCLDHVLQSIATVVHTSGPTILADFSKLPKVMFNDAYMKSILLNLITNAIKYADSERLPVISIVSERINDRNQITVTDNGAGFDAARLRHEVFDFPEKFHKNSNAKGIGLYLVHTQVTSLGGQVNIESKIGEGTRVVIYLADSRRTF